MSRYYCHEYPEILLVEPRVVDAGPGAVLLEQSPSHPGGGGQLADRGVLRWSGGETRVIGIEAVDGRRYWHLVGEPVEMSGAVQAAVDPAFRSMMAQLHTDTHVLNALVCQRFEGALVTGAQLNEDGTARMDFDLPDADNDRLRALEPEINDVIRQDLPVRYAYVGEAAAIGGGGPSGAPPGCPRPPPRTARSGSSRSSGSTGRPAAGPTWPPPPGRAQCES